MWLRIYLKALNYELCGLRENKILNSTQANINLCYDKININKPLGIFSKNTCTLQNPFTKIIPLNSLYEYIISDNFFVTKNDDEMWYLLTLSYDNVNLICKYKKELIETFKITYISDSPILEKINQIKNEGGITVAVHIRQTDYKYVWNGQYYFTPNEVEKQVDVIESEFTRIGKNPFSSFSLTRN